MAAREMSELSRVPNSKLDRIRYLLDHWQDVFSAPVGSVWTGGGSGGGGPALLPGMSRSPAVVELERCLRELSVDERAHLMGYHACEWRIRVSVGSRKRKGGRMESVIVRERARLTPVWVDMAVVSAAEQRLVELFRGPVSLPRDLWEAATLSAAEVDERRRKRRSA